VEEGPKWKKGSVQRVSFFASSLKGVFLIFPPFRFRCGLRYARSRAKKEGGSGTKRRKDKAFPTGMKQEGGTPPPPPGRVEYTHLPTFLHCAVPRLTNHSSVPHRRPEAATSTPNTPVRRHHRPLHPVVQGGLGTTRPVRTALRLRSGPTSSATPYPLLQATQDNSPLAPVDLPPCLVLLLRTTPVRTATAETGSLALRPTLQA
jgi:hypothetical protein